MRIADILLESLEAFSRYESRGSTFYITHRGKDGAILCEAYVAGRGLFDPVREKIAHTLVTFEGDRREGDNGRSVVPYKSFVEAQFRRYGVYSAMLDHLEANGYVVHPADGSIGDKALQAQSADAKAFWEKRKTRSIEVSLIPVSRDEFYGWGKYNPMTNADHVGDMPVLDKVSMRGYANPLLVVWQKQYRDSLQRVGLAYVPQRGMRIGISIEFPQTNLQSRFYGEFDDFPFIRSVDDISYFYHNPYVRAKVKAGTDKAVRALYGALTKMGYTG